MITDESIMVIEAIDLARECLCVSLAQITHLDVVGISGKSQPPMAYMATRMPRLVIVSMILLKICTIALIRRIKKTYPNVPVLALISDKSEDFAAETLRAGADGYILQDAAPDAFGAAIRSALCGRSFSTPDKSASVLDHDAEIRRKRSRTPATADGLTTREREVLILIACALTNKSIARHLGLSLNTVAKYRASLMRKLGTRNAAGLTAHAIARGWTSTDLLKDVANASIGT